MEMKREEMMVRRGVMRMVERGGVGVARGADPSAPVLCGAPLSAASGEGSTSGSLNSSHSALTQPACATTPTWCGCAASARWMTHHAACCRVGAEEQPNALEVALLARNVQRRGAVVLSLVGVSVGAEEQLGALELALLARNVQRRGSAPYRCVDGGLGRGELLEC